MVGFKELLRRLQIQEQMTKQHQTRVDVSLFRLLSKSKKKKKNLLKVTSVDQQRNFVVSETEYTDVLAMIDASRVFTARGGSVRIKHFLITGDKFNAKQFL